MLVLLIKIALDCFYLLISYCLEILNLNLKFAVCCKPGSKSPFRFSRLLGIFFFLWVRQFSPQTRKTELSNSN